MRVFLVIMMLAIALSGFSTASHALGMKNCHSESSIDAKESASGMDCPDHASTADADNSDSKQDCLNCDHCCLSHAAFPATTLGLTVPARNETYAQIDAKVADSAVSGLKRPPKSIV